MPTRRNRTRNGNVLGLAPAAVAATVLLAPFAAVAEQNDLREFRVGMLVSALPQSGYGDFACVAEPAKTLSDWSDYKSCPAGTDGTRAVGFRYDGNPSTQGETVVAGQPVTLALLIDDQAEVAGLRIATDPHTR